MTATAARPAHHADLDRLAEIGAQCEPMARVAKALEQIRGGYSGEPAPLDLLSEVVLRGVPALFVELFAAHDHVARLLQIGAQIRPIVERMEAELEEVRLERDQLRAELGRGNTEEKPT